MHISILYELLIHYSLDVWRHIAMRPNDSDDDAEQQ